ncbi:MAG: hypothetical protein QXD82_02630 [Nitrososphaerales archaeon]
MNELKLTILERLYRRGKIGASHTSIESVVRGLPKHMRGNAKKVVRQLIKDGWIVQHPTSYGMQIALNLPRVQEVRQLIGE